MKPKIGMSRKDVVVTLACLTFLLAVLGAVGATGRRRAKELLCLSNLGRWGQVFLEYAADNDSYFMRGWFMYSTSPVRNTDYWMEAVRSYYGNNHNLRCCPEAAIPGSEIEAGRYFGGLGTFVGWGVFPGECGQPSNWWAPATACDYGSYGMNAWLCDPPRDAPIFQSHNVAKNNWRTANVAGAGDIPLMTDSQWADQWPDAIDAVPEYDGEPWLPYSDYSHMVRVCINRHDGCVNSAFLDGSSRKVPLKCLWKLSWHRTFDPEQGPTEEEFNSAGNGWMAQFPPCE